MTTFPRRSDSCRVLTDAAEGLNTLNFNLQDRKEKIFISGRKCVCTDQRSAGTGAAVAQEPLSRRWRCVFIITVLGQFHLPDGVFHALERATAQAKFRGRCLCRSSQNVASASQHGCIPRTIRQPLRKRLEWRLPLWFWTESFPHPFMIICDSPANVQTEMLQQPMPCDELCFRAFVWWVREVNFLSLFFTPGGWHFLKTSVTAW